MRWVRLPTLPVAPRVSASNRPWTLPLVLFQYVFSPRTHDESDVDLEQSRRDVSQDQTQPSQASQSPKPTESSKSQKPSSPLSELAGKKGLGSLFGGSHHGLGLLPVRDNASSRRLHTNRLQMNGRRDVAEIESRAAPIQGSTLTDVILQGGALGKITKALSPKPAAPQAEKGAGGQAAGGKGAEGKPAGGQSAQGSQGQASGGKPSSGQ